MKTQQQQQSYAPITAYMGLAKDKGGASGWIPYHPAIARAIAPHLRRGAQDKANAAALFLTVCYQMRGRSTVAQGGWFEKTRADWEACLGVSKRTADYLIAVLCYDDEKGPTLAKDNLGLVRRRLGGFRNSSQYLVDDLRVTQFWLTNGPQLALGAGPSQLARPKQVAPLVGQQVAPLVGQIKGQQVAPLVGQQVAPLVGQPHENQKVDGEEKNNINSAADAVCKLLRLYGFTDTEVINQTVSKLAARPDGALQLYFHGEMALAEQVHRAETARPIVNVVGWTWRRLQNIDLGAPVIDWDQAQQQLDAALADLAAHPADSGRRRVPDYEGDERRAQAQAQRRAAVLDILGQSAGSPAPDDDDETAAQKLSDARAELERRRERRRQK